jgi:hypothetical protein
VVDSEQHVLVVPPATERGQASETSEFEDRHGSS